MNPQKSVDENIKSKISIGERGHAIYEHGRFRLDYAALRGNFTFRDTQPRERVFTGIFFDGVFEMAETTKTRILDPNCKKLKPIIGISLKNLKKEQAEIQKRVERIAPLVIEKQSDTKKFVESLNAKIVAQKLIIDENGDRSVGEVLLEHSKNFYWITNWFSPPWYAQVFQYRGDDEEYEKRKKYFLDNYFLRHDI